ncbi:UNVERIFIED_CONTAM: putative AC transposase [Sesamum angustifolium]|uniref:AC transposase n=1 Tax=Sesamum angustifolium TaxID=2727405 RepID=A0AAW2JWW7_9LAMI
MESQPEDTSQPSVRESNNVTESNTEIEMSKDIPDRVEIEETSEDNSKRKRKSNAWNHFKRVKVEGIQFAERNYCKARLKAPTSYGTTHLHKHYEKVCKKQPRKIDIRQSFLKTNQKFGGDQELGTHIFNQEEARCELALMFILHDYPLSVVDHIGFRRYFTCLQPCFNMISRNTLKGDILKIYKDERKKYYNLLGKIRVALPSQPTCGLQVTTKKMARDILAIPISTVAFESAFSSSGKLINPHRNRLHHTTMAALMCSRRWLWNEANDTCSTIDGIQTCPSILDEEDDQGDRDSK